MGIGGWILFVLVVVVASAVIQIALTSNKRKKMESNLNSITDFSPSEKIIGCDGNTGLAIDEQQKKICLIMCNGPSATNKIIPYKEILSVEILEDGTTVTKTSRSSQIGSAAIGGLLFGGAGAVIGGLTGKTETIGKIGNVTLHIVINDIASPTHDVCFMNVEGKRTGIIYKQAIQNARYWKGIIEVLIKQADSEERIKNETNQVTDYNGSTADEIRKLSELCDSGIISKEEFQNQKAKLLGLNK